MDNKALLYYYAQEKRVTLSKDEDFVALDLDRAEEVGIRHEVQALLGEDAENLRRELFMIPRSGIPSEVEERLCENGVLQPVLRHGDAMMVALPEVRVVTSGKKRDFAVRRFLENTDVPSDIKPDRDEGFVVRPQSRRGLDALRLANELHEETSVDVADVHFIRRVPRP